ncbi:DUF2934 domain-containing protein [Ensifer aridi]|uniref:DUF2934 domain-containing protein n=1 Tax=Ensifer aridi TaxID=1708715 RepID=UPI000A11CAB3|nr:DUF2934 domain-containing protein [Ensifer aridi]
MDNNRDMDTNREELIRRRAYAIWEQEGRPEGQHERHWEQASREMQGVPPDGGGEKREGGEATGASPAPSAPEGSPTKSNRKNNGG